MFCEHGKGLNVDMDFLAASAEGQWVGWGEMVAPVPAPREPWSPRTFLERMRGNAIPVLFHHTSAKVPCCTFGTYWDFPIQPCESQGSCVTHKGAAGHLSEPGRHGVETAWAAVPPPCHLKASTPRIHPWKCFSEL